MDTNDDVAPLSEPAAAAEEEKEEKEAEEGEEIMDADAPRPAGVVEVVLDFRRPCPRGCGGHEVSRANSFTCPACRQKAPEQTRQAFDVSPGMECSVAEDNERSLHLTCEDGAVVVHVNESVEFLEANAQFLSPGIQTTLQANRTAVIAELTQAIENNRAAYAEAKQRGTVADVGALAIEHDELSEHLAVVQGNAFNTTFRKVVQPVRVSEVCYRLAPNSSINVGSAMVQWLVPLRGGQRIVNAVYSGQGGEAAPLAQTVLPAITFDDVMAASKLRQSNQVVTFAKTEPGGDATE